MFENPNKLDLGSAEDGTNIGTVELPAWASTPEDFVRIHRQVGTLICWLIDLLVDLLIDQSIQFDLSKEYTRTVCRTNVIFYEFLNGTIQFHVRNFNLLN